MQKLNVYLSIILLSTLIISMDLMQQLEPLRHIDQIILIGAGKGLEYFELLKEYLTFVAFVQPNPRGILIDNAQKYNIPIYNDLDQALKRQKAMES